MQVLPRQTHFPQTGPSIRYRYLRGREPTTICGSCRLESLPGTWIGMTRILPRWVWKTRGTLGQSFDSFRDTPFASVRHGYETVLVKHFGLQYNAEVGAAYMLKTPDLELGELGVNFGAGAGLSYAVGNPTYEDGSDNEPQRRYRTQFLALFDLDWHLIGSDNLSLITRVHHRSGVYGLIAPRHVGSNFLAIGIRRKL